ncbi:MAG TPA: MgtC/SapB family protein [Candidatus Tumulicola sp.]|nr:MgtC/SapB family protein [Candidatus Tumulicola sp.]
MSEHVTATEFAVRLLIGAALGVAIGFERQWRQRTAGMQVSGLVAVGATLFSLAAMAIGGEKDTRIFANIVSGVGFIAGGVILRQGMNVSGLNTAATIWSTAAVGSLAGVGYFEYASVGAAAVIALNLLVSPIAASIDSRSLVYRERHGESLYTLRAVCTEEAEGAVRTTIVQTVSTTKLNLRALTTGTVEDGSEVRAELRLSHRDDTLIEKLANALGAHPDVRKVTWRIAEAE